MKITIVSHISPMPDTLQRRIMQYIVICKVLDYTTISSPIRVYHNLYRGDLPRFCDLELRMNIFDVRPLLS
jgi:hypothetical protein